ncbi:unnamed protein product [Lactuca virosa]|uniref:Uncharacterized protein n=1 Tax=Lactuca virosa TaxID=75947 RepID=A0AAU9N2P3_9ASTR|nr:unnamed protein product [Lactuca virosa]
MDGHMKIQPKLKGGPQAWGSTKENSDILYLTSGSKTSSRPLPHTALGLTLLTSSSLIKKTPYALNKKKRRSSHLLVRSPSSSRILPIDQPVEDRLQPPLPLHRRSPAAVPPQSPVATAVGIVFTCDLCCPRFHQCLT